jgi:hypothetical protein
MFWMVFSKNVTETHELQGFFCSYILEFKPKMGLKLPEGNLIIVK